MTWIRLRLLSLLLLAFPLFCLAQPQDPGLELKDEGTSQGFVDTVDCVGAGVACTVSGIDGTLTVSGGGSSALDDLSDVTISAVADGELLQFDNGTSMWINQTFAEAGVAASSDIHGDGANCSAGEYPLGVDAAGAVQSCTDATTEINSAISTHAGVSDAHQDLVTLGGTGTYLSLAGQIITVDPITESDISDLDHTATAITDGLIVEADLNEDSGTPTDEDVLTYDSTGANFNWVAQSTLAAGTAAALAANGANCAAGEIALGVDAAGAVEGCYEPTEADITDLDHTGNASTTELLFDNAGTVDGIATVTTDGTDVTFNAGDLILGDDDQLILGDGSDVVFDWDSAGSKFVTDAATLSEWDINDLALNLFSDMGSSTDSILAVIGTYSGSVLLPVSYTTTYDGTGGIVAGQGFQNNFTYSGTGAQTVGTMAANSNVVQVSTTQNVSQLAGSQSTIQATGTAGSATISFANPVTAWYNVASSTGDFTATLLKEFEAISPTGDALDVITTRHGLYVNDAASFGGTITTQHGVYVEDMDGEATTNMEFFAAGTGGYFVRDSALSIQSLSDGEMTFNADTEFQFLTGQVKFPNYTFPLADGTINQVLSTDGAGTLSFVAAGGGGSPGGSDGQIQYNNSSSFGGASGMEWDDIDSELQFDDNIDAVFGTGEDASIVYDGTDLVISSIDVGSGDILLNGTMDINSLGYIGLDSAGAATNVMINVNSSGSLRGALGFIYTATSGALGANINNNFTVDAAGMSTAYVHLGEIKRTENPSSSGNKNDYVYFADIGYDNSTDFTQSANYKQWGLRVTHANGTGGASSTFSPILYGVEISSFSDVSGTGSATLFGINTAEAILLRDDVGLYFEGTNTTFGDTFMVYDSTDTDLEMTVDNVQVADFDNDSIDFNVEVNGTVNPVIDVYDNAGGQTISTAITVNLDTTRKNSDTNYYTLASDQITVLVTGTYMITYSGTADQSGTARTTVRWYLENNAVEIDGSTCFSYHRITADGEATCTRTIVLDLTANDVIHLEAIKHGTATGTTSTRVDGSSLTIMKLAV